MSLVFGTYLGTYLGPMLFLEAIREICHFIETALFFYFSKASFQGIFQYAYLHSRSRHIRSARRAEYPLSGAFPDACFRLYIGPLWPAR